MWSKFLHKLASGYGEGYRFLKVIPSYFTMDSRLRFCLMFFVAPKHKVCRFKIKPVITLEGNIQTNLGVSCQFCAHFIWLSTVYTKLLLNYARRLYRTFYFVRSPVAIVFSATVANYCLFLEANLGNYYLPRLNHFVRLPFCSIFLAICCSNLFRYSLRLYFFTNIVLPD